MSSLSEVIFLIGFRIYIYCGCDRDIAWSFISNYWIFILYDIYIYIYVVDQKRKLVRF